MPVNDAIAAASDLDAIRKRLAEKQRALAELNARRSDLITEIDSLQAEVLAKRAVLRAAAADL